MKVVSKVTTQVKCLTVGIMRAQLPSKDKKENPFCQPYSDHNILLAIIDDLLSPEGYNGQDMAGKTQGFQSQQDISPTSLDSLLKYVIADHLSSLTIFHK